MKTKLFIDFDDTLFDRDIFRQELVALVKNHGFSDEEVENGYQAVYKNSGYDGALAHLKYLSDNIRPVDMNQAETDVKELFVKAEKLLFSDALKFLQEIDRDQFEVDLITVGGLDFQKAKVGAVKIAEYFDHRYFITEEKSEALSGLVSVDEPFILVEDKESTIQSVREKFPKAIVLKATKDNLLENLRIINSKSYA